MMNSRSLSILDKKGEVKPKENALKNITEEKYLSDQSLNNVQESNPFVASTLLGLALKDTNLPPNKQKSNNNNLKPSEKKDSINQNRNMSKESHKSNGQARIIVQKENSDLVSKQEVEKSISEPVKPRVRAVNAGYMGDGSGNNGDEEPVLPRIIYREEQPNNQKEEALVPSHCEVNEGNTEECRTRRRCLCKHLKAKTDTNLSQLSLRKNISVCNSQANMQSDHAHLNSMDCIIAGEANHKDTNNDASVAKQYNSHSEKENVNLPEPKKLNQTANKSARDDSRRRNNAGHLPKLSTRDSGSQSFQVEGAHNDKSTRAQKPFLKASYLYDLTKKSVQFSSAASTPVNQTSAIATKKNYVHTRLPKSQNSIDESFENNIRMTSNLLGSVSNDLRSLKNFIRSDLNTKKHNLSNLIDATPSSISNQPDSSAQFDLGTRVKTPTLRQRNSLLDSNTLVRGAYRIKKNTSAKDLDVRSERDVNVNSEQNPNDPSEIPSLHNELCDKIAPVENINMNKRQENSKAKLNSKTNLEKKIRDRIVHHRNSSVNSIEVERRYYSSNPSNQISHSKKKEGLSNLSLMNSSNLERSISRNRPAADRLHKELEEHKKKFAKEDAASLIQFQSIGNPSRSQSKGIPFERNRRKSLVMEVPKTAAPTNSQASTPTRKSGFSFGKNRRLDMTRLPQIEDANKMLDPIQRLSRALEK